ADSKLLVTLSYIAEVAARLGDERHVAAIYRRLEPFADQAITVPAFTLCCGAAARYLGLLADALGDFSRAESHFQRALVMSGALSAWPWLAHTRFDFARMLGRRGGKADRRRAMELTASALETARELGMHALVRRIGSEADRKSLN